MPDKKKAKPVSKRARLPLGTAALLGAVLAFMALILTSVTISFMALRDIDPAHTTAEATVLKINDIDSESLDKVVEQDMLRRTAETGELPGNNPFVDPSRIVPPDAGPPPEGEPVPDLQS